MSTPHTPDPDFGQNPQNPQNSQNPQYSQSSQNRPYAQSDQYAQGQQQGPYQGQPQTDRFAAGQYQSQSAAGASQQAPPKAPTSDSAGPARPLTVGSAPRSLMRVGIAVVGVLALLVPVSALAYTGVGLSTLVREETTHDLPMDLEALTVDAHSATVEVESRDDIDAPLVRHTYQGADTAISAPEITDDEGTATVSIPRAQRDSNWWTPNVGMEDTITIELPSDQARKMDLDVMSDFGFTDLAGEFNDVRVQTKAGAMVLDLDASTVDARTRTGFLDVSGAMADLSMEATAGYIDASHLEVAETVSARTTTGGIELGFSGTVVPVQGIEAHAKNGAVTVSLPREENLVDQDVTGYSVNASSSSGWTDVAVQQTPPGDGVVPVTVSSESGSVDVHYRDGSDGMDTDGDSASDWEDGWEDDQDAPDSDRESNRDDRDSDQDDRDSDRDDRNSGRDDRNSGRDDRDSDRGDDATDGDAGRA